MAPNASAKIASDVATTRRRMREMRSARARSFSRASSFAEWSGSAGVGSEGVGSCMAAKVGAPCESGPGRPRELPGALSTLDQGPGRARATPGRRADHLSWQGLRARPRRRRSPHETEGPQARRDRRRLRRARRRRLRRGVDGVAASAGSGSSAAQGARAQPGPGGFDLSALATKLGVSESKLRAAMEKTRPSGTPGAAPGASGTDPATALAEELGLSAAKVRAAMQALAPAGAPPSGAAPQGSGSSTSSSTQSGTAA